MALPRKLKHLNAFNDGASYLGEVVSFTRPKQARKMEEYRSGGMNGPVKIDNGVEAVEAEMTLGGYMADIVKQFGVETVDGVQLRLLGSLQRENSADVDAFECVLRGRWEEIDGGESKSGEDTETKGKFTCAYYKESLNGEELYEIDLLNMVERSGGIDRLAAHRAAIGA